MIAQFVRYDTATGALTALLGYTGSEADLDSIRQNDHLVETTANPLTMETLANYEVDLTTKQVKAKT